jgi:hypothetical protein
MKKFLLTIVLALMPSLFFGQSIFDKFDGPDDVTAVIVNKKMFEMMGKVNTKDKDAQQFLKLVKNLENLRVFSTTNSKIAADMKATATKYMRTAGLEDLMRVNEKGKNIRIAVKSGPKEQQITELLMFIEGSGKDESVILSLTGLFDLDDLSVLTDRMNLPGGEDIKRASKSNK